VPTMSWDTHRGHVASGTDPVQKITVIPRGIAALGYTMQVPTEDRFLMSKTELETRSHPCSAPRRRADRLRDISTGAHNDLSRATDIARSMVKEYGMSNVARSITPPTAAPSSSTSSRRA